MFSIDFSIGTESLAVGQTDRAFVARERPGPNESTMIGSDLGLVNFTWLYRPKDLPG